MNNYSELPALEGVFLEDSYVLGFTLTYTTFSMLLEARLEATHRLYARLKDPTAPRFRKMTMTFDELGDFHWTGQRGRPSFDPDGSIDYGCIDALTFEGSEFHLQGDLGELRIHATQLVVEFEQDRVSRFSDSK